MFKEILKSFFNNLFQRLILVFIVIIPFLVYFAFAATISDLTNSPDPFDNQAAPPDNLTTITATLSTSQVMMYIIAS